MTDQQRARRNAIAKGASAVRKTLKNAGEGYKLLGKHAANGFVNSMWKNVLIEPKVDKGRYANNDTVYFLTAPGTAQKLKTP